jgi:hypothetical protein
MKTSNMTTFSTRPLVRPVGRRYNAADRGFGIVGGHSQMSEVGQARTVDLLQGAGVVSVFPLAGDPDQGGPPA